MEILNDYNLTFQNSYHINSVCSRAFFPECEEDFYKIYSKYSDPLSKIILGGGNNVILSKTKYNQDFILIGKAFSKITLEYTGLIAVEAGVSTSKLCEYALNHSLSGVEIFYDIPSSMGGAVVMNAGANGEQISDVLVKVRYLDLSDFQIKEILNEDIGFEYRNSFFQKNHDKIVLKIWLKLNPAHKEDIQQKMDSIKRERWQKQPREYPNAGSVFKRPQGHYVGAMIEELGLKGYSVGGAQISEKHGGFIINRNNATGEDILAIIKVVKEKVKKNFGVDLEIEQRVI